MTTSTRPASTEVPAATGDVLDAAGLRRSQLVLHLHRFDDDDRLAGGDLVARRRRARGRRGRASARRSPARRRLRPAASPRPRRVRRPLTRGRRRSGRRATTKLSPPGARRARPALSRLDPGVAVDEQRQPEARRRGRASTIVERGRRPSPGTRVAAGPLDRDACGSRPSISISNVIRASASRRARRAATGCAALRAPAPADGPRVAPRRYASSAAAMRHQLFARRRPAR